MAQEERQLGRTIGNALAQQYESLLTLSQPRVNQGQRPGRHVRGSLPLEFLKDPSGIPRAARLSMRMGHTGDGKSVPVRKVLRSAQFANGLGQEPLLFVD